MNYQTWEKNFAPRNSASPVWAPIKHNTSRYLVVFFWRLSDGCLFLWILVSSLIIWHFSVAMIIYSHPQEFERMHQPRVHSWPPFWAPHTTLPRVLHHQPSCQLFVLPFLFEFRAIVLNGGWSSPNRGGTRINPKNTSIPQITRRKGTYNHSRRYISWNSCVDHTKNLLIEAVEQPPTSRTGWRDLFSSSICRILWLATTSYQFQKTICEWQGIGLNLHVSDVVGSHFFPLDLRYCNSLLPLPWTSLSFLRDDDEEPCPTACTVIRLAKKSGNGCRW